MLLWLKCFCTLIILIIAKNSSSEILPCKYDETINISHFKRFNDVYIYENFEIPANLTGEFDYMELMGGAKVPVKIHLRACICKVRPCIRVCCARKNILNNGQCNDGVQKEIKLTMLDLTKKDILLKPLAERNITPHHNSTELMVLREQFKPCDQVISLKRDEYSMLKDGAMFLHKSAQTLSNDQYCLYPEIYSDFPETIWVINRKCFKNNSAELTMISVVCYILTLAVYLSVKKLRNLLGKCLICTIFCLFIENFIWTLDHFRLVFDICAATGYIQYYFTISSYLWLSVVSFQLWEVLTSLKREEPQYRFLIYNTVVWCTAAIPTGVIVSMNQIRENNPEKSRSLPHDGYTGCSDTDMSNCYTPLIITDIFNATMFVLTSIHIWKVKREVKRFAQQDIRSSTCFEFDFQTYIQFLRLFMIMGANWIIYQLTEIVDFMKSSIIKSLTVYIQDSFGIILFVLLILKSSTLKVIMESIRGT